jgi:hypothetical protein
MPADQSDERTKRLLASVAAEIQTSRVAPSRTRHLAGLYMIGWAILVGLAATTVVLIAVIALHAAQGQ